ncbi:hypothetical protein AB1Y20_009351 [Prymnesium parvum]|uniref:Protein kinase domain-containing protein n=1 Tax=Prymnesium parvum TaxID=97485 RepID=A0AB34K5F0_PRYPA
MQASEVVGILTCHRRREERLCTAWFGLSKPDYMAAWSALGLRKANDVDALEFEKMIAADIEKHKAPTDFNAFIDHYNRLMEERAAFFRRQYRIKELLGMGGFSKVVSAKRLIDGNSFALKISAKNFTEKRSIELLEDELRIWAKEELIHPGLVQLFGFFELPEATVLVTEICEGGCLLDALEEVESMNEASVRKIGAQVISAILHLHQVARVIHRDIKPENVLCTHSSPHIEGRVLLSDFGLAAEFESSGLARLVGTPEYLAPELVDMLHKGRKAMATGGPRPQLKYDERVDTWALGVLMYELFTGFPPFNDADENKLLRKILGEDGSALEFPNDPFGCCSPGCISLLRALLDRDPGKRLFGDALRSEADSWLHSELPEGGTFSQRPTFAIETAKFRRRKLKATGLATKACVRFAIEGRNSAAASIQQKFRNKGDKASAPPTEAKAQDIS